ncbi:MAG: hypothetical protein Q8R33_01120 [Burkholderiales bacterium]|nr:hypothetical protein [Burkholderiales bacterium]
MNASITSLPDSGFEIRFQSLFKPGRALSFPCNALGQVQLDSLSDRARDNYFYARAVVGREFAYPSVQLSCTC